MQNFFATFIHNILITSPLFFLMFLGYGLMAFLKWPKNIPEALNKFVFSIALPTTLFTLMLDFSNYHNIDYRLLFAFFGSCLIVFIIARIIAATFFKMDAVSGSVFAIAGIFSNNVMLGIPMTMALLGAKAMPSVALILVFNALILWTLVTISIEWSQSGRFSLRAFFKMAQNVLCNPIIIAIFLGLALSLLRVKLPENISTSLSMLAKTSAPISMITLGMGLAEYGIRSNWQISLGISLIKLLLQPLVIWLLARMLNLPLIETQAVVLLGSIAIGVNVYLMSKKFKVLEGVIASGLVLTSVLASFTTPLILTVISFF